MIKIIGVLTAFLLLLSVVKQDTQHVERAFRANVLSAVFWCIC